MQLGKVKEEELLEQHQFLIMVAQIQYHQQVVVEVLEEQVVMVRLVGQVVEEDRAHQVVLVLQQQIKDMQVGMVDQARKNPVVVVVPVVLVLLQWLVDLD